MSSIESVTSAVEASEKAHGGAVDLLVCNAGYAAPGYILDQSFDVFKREIVRSNVDVGVWWLMFEGWCLFLVIH